MINSISEIENQEKNKPCFCKLFYKARTSFLIVLIIIAHVFIVTWMSFWNSPNGNEPGHLAAGVYTLRFGRTDLYRVNPPLSRMIAAIPATYLFDIDADWLSTATNILSYRPEYEVGTSLYFKNDPNKLYLAFVFGRLMLLPFSLLGAWVCYRFSYELYGKSSALLAMLLWCFNPYVLTWAATINPDITATSIGIFSFYLFRKYCQKPSWQNILWTGGVAGLLLVTKTVWIIIFIIWLILCFISYCSEERKLYRKFFVQFGKLCLVFAIAVTVLNTFYNFSGSFQLLKKYSFISASLTGDSHNIQETSKNRFAESWLGNIPVPFPQDYVYGIDVQKYDFERGIPSYINGVWSDRGVWYYYFYAFFLKTPIGFQVLIILSFVFFVIKKEYRLSLLNESILLIPLVTILFLISYQNGFSVHSRYLLPLLPFLFVGTSKIALIFNEKILSTRYAALQFRLFKIVVFFLVGWGIVSSVSVFPHSMSYFNEIAGGSDQGAKYLLGSDFDWGQDVYYLQQWQQKHSDARPLRIALSGTMPLEKTEIKYDGVVPQEGDGTNVFASIKPGWYAININNLYGKKNEYKYLRNKKSIGKAGYTILLYYFSENEIDSVRKKFNLPSLEKERTVTVSFIDKLVEKKTFPLIERNIAIYSDKGVADDSLKMVASLLQKEKYAYQEIDIPSIQKEELSKYDLLIVPGGLSNEMADALGNEGREAIRKFVHHGGGYVGICAGAYLASATFEKFLGLVNVKSNHSQEYMPRIGMQEQRQLGSGTVKLEFSTEGEHFFAKGAFGNMEYINGPIFIDAGRSDLPFFVILAAFRSDIYRYNFQQGTMPNTPAIVAGQFGQGYVILFSPHPELTNGTESMFLDAVRAVKKQNEN